MAEMHPALEDLREFQRVPLPEDPQEFRFAALLVRSVIYLVAAAPLVLVVAILIGLARGTMTTESLSGNWLLLLALLATIPTFILLAYSFPAFVAGERWALGAIALVGVGLLLLMPIRFLTEAANRPGQVAVPPTRVEWIVFIASAVFLYFLLSPETRAGMRAARAKRASLPRIVQSTPATTAQAHAQAPAQVRYVCPECGRVYHLPKAPPPGSLCPRCRRA